MWYVVIAFILVVAIAMIATPIIIYIEFEKLITLCKQEPPING